MEIQGRLLPSLMANISNCIVSNTTCKKFFDLMDAAGFNDYYYGGLKTGAKNLAETRGLARFRNRHLRQKILC